MENKSVMDVNLVEFIGQPAMLEQTAEECAELGKACLKMARLIRGENPVYNCDKEGLYKNLVEEAADVQKCIEELIGGGLISAQDLWDAMIYKQERKLDRLRKEGKI